MAKRESKEEATGVQALDNHLSSLEKRFEGVVAKIDALIYVKSVENAFQNEKEKYTLFHQILNDFSEDRIDVDETIRRIEVLFRNHKELLIGFNRFLTVYEELKLDNAREPVNFEDAISFVNKVKNRFGGESNEYKSFLGILESFRQNTTSRTEVYYTAVRLFQDQQDLLEDFRKFVP